MVAIATCLCIGLTIVCFSSCCTKKGCLGTFDMGEIYLSGFTLSDADSIILETYEAKSNFTKRVDSVLVSGREGGILANDSELTIYTPISKRYEYKFTFIVPEETYTLTDFVVKNEICNCPGDYFEVVKGYSINGKKINASRIIIEKK